MKTEILIATVVLSTLVVSLNGCKKEEAAPAAPAAADAPKPIEAMTNEAAKIVDTATPAAKEVTDQSHIPGGRCHGTIAGFNRQGQGLCR